VDAIVQDFGKYVYDNAESIAAAAHNETGLGVYEDKVAKAKGKACVIWNNLKGKKSRGIIGEDDEANLIFVAKPMGVVAAVCPVTNPIVTPMCNAMFALKAGNAIIFAPHPKAEAATRDLTRAYREILKRHGAPEDFVQMVTNGSVETTQALMTAADVVVATGGGAMVKAAYSSGKPSYGVGAGNEFVARIGWLGSGDGWRRRTTPSVTQDLHRAVQGQCHSPSPHPKAAAPSDELARV
jgi:succinate-semialdehyde dehydrogenase